VTESSSSNRSDHGERWSSERVLESIATAEDPDTAITLGIVDRIGLSDPTLADAIRCCAIPRRFNAEILAVTRDDPDSSSSQQLLQKLVSLTFVVTVGQDQYRYDETTRHVLLADWQGRDLDRFMEINRRLIEYYERQHDSARSLESDLWRVRGVVQQVNPSRYAQLATMVESAVTGPLLEVIYHGSLRSADEGYGAFRDFFFEYEARGQVAICESLLNAVRRDIHDAHPTEATMWSDWLTYFQTRLDNSLGRESLAETRIRSILDRGGAEPMLKIWLLSELGRSLELQTKFREAVNAYTDELKVQDEHPDVDPLNLANTHSSLARMQRTFNHLDEAGDGYRKAAELAKENSNPSAEFAAMVSLSAVLQEAGRWEEAVSAALAALHLARTQLRRELSRHQDIAEQLAALMIDHRPALAETAFQTGNALVAVISPGMDRFRHALAYVDMLRDGGQVRRGRERFEQLKKESEGVDDPLIRAWIRLAEAEFAAVEGDVRKAVSLNAGVVEDTDRLNNTPWQRAVALHRSAVLELSCAMWAEAHKHASQAADEWRTMGLEDSAAGAEMVLAEVARHRGDLQAAQRIIERAEPILAKSAPIWRAELYETKGHLLEDRGEWAAAAQLYQAAVEILGRLDNRREAAGILERLARMSGRQGKWEEAAHWTEEAASLWHALGDLDSYLPSDASIASDRANARGIRLYAEAEGNTRYRFAQARDLFRQASDLTTRNPWHPLNLSYACAELEEWDEACRAVEIALSRRDVLPESFFSERLAEYRAAVSPHAMSTPQSSDPEELGKAR
jgi:tetratricopeptide (TPR) repeat protein